MLYVLMTQVALNCSGIGFFPRQIIPAAVAKHVGMNREWYASKFAHLLYNATDGIGSKRGLTGGGEEKGSAWVLLLQPA